MYLFNDSASTIRNANERCMNHLPVLIGGFMLTKQRFRIQNFSQTIIYLPAYPASPNSFKYIKLMQVIQVTSNGMAAL